MMAPGRKLRILVVDDNTQFCENLKDLVELEGHEAMTAYDGATAVEIARRTPPDLVLLDLVMPGLDGPATLKRLREQLPGLAAIVVTAFGEEDILTRVLELGVTGYVKKPLDYPKLVELLDTVRLAS